MPDTITKCSVCGALLDEEDLFCANCGTGLFYTNANFLPGVIDIQSATYDDPNAVPATVHIQTAERLHWMESAHELPTFERYPPQA